MPALPTNQPAHPARTEPLRIAGPVTDDVLRTLQARIETKRAEALQFLGDRWILHPKNKVL